MPRATDEQRQAFADALTEAMRKKGESLSAGLRLDEWLAKQTGQSSQAIRNYLSAIREPRNGGIVEKLEDALDLPRYALGQYLGYGPGVSERVAELEGRVDALARTLEQVLEVVAELQTPAARRAPRAR